MKDGPFQFQKLPEVCGTFGLDRVPAFHFIQKLRKFPPNLTDAIILTSTVSEAVGLLTRSSKPLAASDEAIQSVNNFATTSMADDSRRAELPLNDDYSNSSPIGMVLDLSSKTKVHRPLPAEEMDQSSTPLPALLILNNMGVLAGWWFTYADSIRNGIAYPGLVHAEQPRPQTQAPFTATGSPSHSAQPVYGQSSFSNTTGSGFSGGIKPSTAVFGAPTMVGGSTSSTFGQATSSGLAQPSFGATSSLGLGGPAFGSPSILGGTPVSAAKGAVFGAPSGIGGRSSPWGGSASKPSFGNASAIGSPASPWAAAGSAVPNTATSGSVFGQPSGPVTNTSPSNNAAQTAFEPGAGFAAFSNAGGFSSLPKGPSIFGPQSSDDKFKSAVANPIFGSHPAIADSQFGSKSDPASVFGNNSTTTASNALFGSTSKFDFGSKWKNQNPEGPSTKSEGSDGGSLFGNDFSKMLANASHNPPPVHSQEREMSDEMSDSVQETDISINQREADKSTTPAKTPLSSVIFPTSQEGEHKFDAQPLQDSFPVPDPTSQSKMPQASTPIIKTVSPTELPLPPDATSKATFTPATSSVTSTDSAFRTVPETAPLPPDFTKTLDAITPSAPARDVETTTPTAVSGPQQSSMGETIKDTNPSAPILLDSLSLKTKPDASTSFVGRSNAIFSSKPDERESESADEEVEEDDEESEEDDEEDSYGDDEEDEGSGIDLGEEIIGTRSPRISPDNSFARPGSNLTEGSWTNVKFPSRQTSQTRKDLFDDIHFPAKQPDNERSPSPERRIPNGMLRPGNTRPVHGSSIVAGQKIVLPRTMKQVKPLVSFEQRKEEEGQRIARKAAQNRAQEQQPLEDAEDEIIRRLLESSIEGVTELEDFIAHQDYTAPITKVGIPGQIERIYRDINSMIDTVGLNCRNIQRFMKGHEEGFNDGRELEDLPKATSWTLAEIQDLEKLERELHRTLDSVRIRNVQGHMDTIQRLQHNVKKLFTHQRELRAIGDIQFDSSMDDEQYRDLDLSVEHQFQREDLQTKIKNFQTKLMETESAAAILRTKLATAGNSSFNGVSQKVPTMEAVSNTVRKMTSKIEEKSGDIDVLEARMRKLGMDTSSPSSTRNSSCHGSPMTTPPSSSHKHRATLLLGGGVNNSSPLRNTWRTSNNGFDDSVNSNTSNSGPRLLRQKKIAEYTAEDIEPFVRRAERKKILMRLLRDAMAGKDGEKVVKVVEVD